VDFRNGWRSMARTGGGLRIHHRLFPFLVLFLFYGWTGRNWRELSRELSTTEHAWKDRFEIFPGSGNSGETGHLTLDSHAHSDVPHCLTFCRKSQTTGEKAYI